MYNIVQQSRNVARVVQHYYTHNYRTYCTGIVQLALRRRTHHTRYASRTSPHIETITNIGQMIAVRTRYAPKSINGNSCEIIIGRVGLKVYNI